MTTALPITGRKRGPRIRGICADAAALGVTHEHLALVLRGKRKSEPLLARYQALKQSQHAERMNRSRIPESTESPETHKPLQLPPPPELAALQNLQPSFFACLAKLGLEVLIVRFNAEKDSAMWRHNYVALVEELGNELIAIKAGEFDSSLFLLGAHWHFYQVKRAELGAAVRRIKEILDARGLLGISQIFHAESAELLRQWFPGTGAESAAESAMAYAWKGDELTLKYA